jgi:uncharacterized SAM-binding protein YcdF (DUF218 family)
MAKHHKHKRFIVLAMVLVLLLSALSLNTAPLLWWSARLLQHWETVPPSSDAMFILLGDAAPRAAYAAMLFREGRAPLIGLARPERDAVFDLGLSPEEHAVACSVLTALGVPRDRLVVLPEAVTSTRDEAHALTQWARESSFEHIIVVTSSYHSQRAYWTLRRVLQPHGIAISMAPVPYPGIDWNPWWQSEEGLVTVFNETAKTLFYRLRYRGDSL